MPNFLQELKRRNVFRVAGVYAVVGWLLIQVAVALETALSLPAWFDAVITASILIGYPIALVLAWAFEVTPDGVKLTKNVAEGESITAKTGAKLDYAILIGLALVVATIVADRVMPHKVQLSDDNRAENEADAASNASIAVLPFEDLSPEGDQEYFSDGVSEEILNALAPIEGLRVASRTSAFAYKNSPLRIPEIADELGVRHILEGSVRRSGQSIRVTAQLIDAQTDEHLLSETFDRTLTAENVFAIQSEIAQQIVKALSERIELKGVADAVTVKADTEDLATLDLYYEANALFIARGRENLTRAMGLFEQITVRDPDFARGWSGLAMVYAVARGWGLPLRDYQTLGAEAAHRAIDLNPNLSSAYAALGNLEQDKLSTGTGRPDWAAALDNFEKALRLDARDANIYNWRGVMWQSAGFQDRAIAEFNTCLDLDPAYINCGYNLSDIFYLKGDFDAAVKLDEQLMRRGALDQIWGQARIERLVEAGDRHRLLIALSMMVRAVAPDQTWIVGELDDAYFNPPPDRAARYASILARLNAAGYDNVDSTLASIISSAFEQYDKPPYLAALPDAVGVFRGFTPELQRRYIIDAGLPEFWRAQGFPPQCKPRGDKDFECD